MDHPGASANWYTGFAGWLVMKLRSFRHIVGGMLETFRISNG